MSSFNLIQKVKYTQDASAPVSLDEYIIFADEREEQKYIVFKFLNNVTQQLLGMEFEVSQYDLDGDLLETSTVIYTKFLAKANEEFVPKAKLKVNYHCKSISVKLRKAAFDRVLWHDGEYEDNSYKFVHYFGDEEKAKGKKDKKEKKADASAEVNVKPKKRVNFKVKNVTRKNVAKFPAVLCFICCVLIAAFCVCSVFYFKDKSPKFTLDGFDLRIVEGDTVAIYGYDGDDKDLVIPAEIDKYSVTKIDGGAFVNSEITSITFKSETLIIDENAFENCDKLTTVTAEGGQVIVYKNAFNGCAAIEQINMPGAYLYEGAFNGSVFTRVLIFSNTAATRFIDIFGGNEHKTTVTYCKSGVSLPNGFFDGVRVFGI